MTDKTDNDSPSPKAPYEAPDVTDHGSLKDHTKSGTPGGVDFGNS